MNYKNEIEKIAQTRYKIPNLTQEESDEFHNLNDELSQKRRENVKQSLKGMPKSLAGYSMATVGAGALNKVRREGMLDGLVRRYHNTDASNVESIKNSGIKKSKATDEAANILTRMSTGLSGKEMEGKVYLGKNRTIARGAGAQRYKMQNSGTWYIPSDEESLIKSFKDQKTLKVNIPLDEYKKLNKTLNPELKGAKNVKEFSKVIKNRAEGLGLPPSKLRDYIAANSAFKQLSKNTDTITDDIASKFIKGSKDYNKQTISSIGKHIKNNPKIFAKGLGIAGAGLGAMGVGGYMVGKQQLDQYNNNKKFKEENKDKIDRLSRLSRKSLFGK